MISGKVSSLSILLMVLMLIITFVNGNPIEKRNIPGGRLAPRDSDSMAAPQVTGTVYTINGSTFTLMPPVATFTDFGPLHDPSSSWTFPEYPTSIDFGNGATTPTPGWTGLVLPPPRPTTMPPLPTTTPCAETTGAGKDSPKTTQAP